MLKVNKHLCSLLRDLVSSLALEQLILNLNKSLFVWKFRFEEQTKTNGFFLCKLLINGLY